MSDKNVSLVAFYGNKPPQLVALIQKLQTYLTHCKLVRNCFIPYQLEQVHGTIIGCEGTKTESGIIDKWFYDRRQETKYIDIPGLVDYLQHQIVPITIRFGGYDRTSNYNFLSRDRHLYYRSFQLQQAQTQTIPVLIGWSWDNSVTLAIDDLRRNLQQFNLLHKYHQTPEAIDNDFYLRLGTINRQLTSEEINTISTDIRNLLATQPPNYIPITVNDLAFARYQDLLLTPVTTKAIAVTEISANQLLQLYSYSAKSL